VLTVILVKGCCKLSFVSILGRRKEAKMSSKVSKMEKPFVKRITYIFDHQSGILEDKRKQRCIVHAEKQQNLLFI
jgi:hypothetical protein